MALVRRRNGLRSSPERGWDLASTGNFSTLLGDFDSLFSELASPLYSQSQWAQSYPVDMYETSEDIVLEMAVPGIAVDDLDISVEGRQLSIKGQLPESNHEGRRYWLQTIPRGQFSRTVTLPTSVDIDAIEASVSEGLLTLTMPKVAEAKARKIAISNG